jgi:hypothetical protein
LNYLCGSNPGRNEPESRYSVINKNITLLRDNNENGIVMITLQTVCLHRSSSVNDEYEFVVITLQSICLHRMEFHRRMDMVVTTLQTIC